MASRLEIINAALHRLSASPLEFATDQASALFGEAGVVDPEDEQQARTAAIYPSVRHRLLNAHRWSWLRERHRPQLLARRGIMPPDSQDALAPRTEPAEFNPSDYAWQYRLSYPWVGTLDKVYFKGDSEPATEGWIVEGGYLWSKEREIANVVDHRQISEEAWPQLFVNIVELQLASELAIPVAFDEGLARYYKQEAKEALEEALRMDGQSSPSEMIPSNPWIEARLGSTRRYRRGVV